MKDPLEVFTDPLKFQQTFWPHIKFYDKQVEIIKSVENNDETVVPAGNQLGKDFISAFIALWFFCSRVPARVITTSVDFAQLEGVLWGEIRRFIQDARYPLPVHATHLHIRQLIGDRIHPLSELRGRVVQHGEGLLGRHIAISEDGRPRTLVIFDEASGLSDSVYESADTWAHRKLVIGNCYPCHNFFYHAVKEGDLVDPNYENKDEKRYYRKVIQIRGSDSPNVKLGVLQEDRGLPITNKIVVPGVLEYERYKKRLITWDEVRKCIGLQAQFYEGSETLMYPPQWLDRAEQVHKRLERLKKRLGFRVMGVDAAEGGDSTVWTVIDELGILFQKSIKTSNTNDIPNITVMLMREWTVKDTDVLFDVGGGGKYHADRLRSKGYNHGEGFQVRTVSFKEAPSDSLKLKNRDRNSKQKERDDRRLYRNRRAEMYGILRNMLNPELNERGFGMPAGLAELRRQLSLIPLLYDKEGELYMLPKSKRDIPRLEERPGSKVECLRDILGCSPDECDSLVLATFGLTHRKKVRIFGAA